MSHSLVNRERFYILMKVLCFIFFVQNFKMATVGIRQLGNWDWPFLKFIWPVTFFLISRMKRMPGAECNSYGVRE